MNASTGKIFGIIVVVLLVFFAVGAIRFLFMAPYGVFQGGGWHGWQRWFDDWGWPWIGFAGLFGLAALIVWIAVVVWVYRDAEKHGMNAAIWALVVLFTHLVGLVIYLIVRGSHPLAVPSGGGASSPASPPPGGTATAPPVTPSAGPLSCPNCGKPVGPDQAFCAHCGTRLRPACPNCGSEIRAEWKACPNCGTRLKD
jgi:cbb3-type cytochrome oxidase subunit 3